MSDFLLTALAGIILIPIICFGVIFSFELWWRKRIEGDDS
jgi:hypothetical protein